MQPGQLVGLFPWLAGLSAFLPRPKQLCQSSSARALARAELTALLVVGAVESRGSGISVLFYSLIPLMCINLLLVLRTEPLEKLYSTLSFITVTEYDQSILLKLYFAS